MTARPYATSFNKLLPGSVPCPTTVTLKVAGIFGTLPENVSSSRTLWCLHWYSLKLSIKNHQHRIQLWFKEESFYWLATLTGIHLINMYQKRHRSSDFTDQSSYSRTIIIPKWKGLLLPLRFHNGNGTCLSIPEQYATEKIHSLVN